MEWSNRTLSLATRTTADSIHRSREINDPLNRRVFVPENEPSDFAAFDFLFPYCSANITTWVVIFVNDASSIRRASTINLYSPASQRAALILNRANIIVFRSIETYKSAYRACYFSFVIKNYTITVHVFSSPIRIPEAWEIRRKRLYCLRFCILNFIVNSPLCVSRTRVIIFLWLMASSGFCNSAEYARKFHVIPHKSLRALSVTACNIYLLNNNSLRLFAPLLITSA
jgi:hypothetical protein